MSPKSTPNLSIDPRVRRTRQLILGAFEAQLGKKGFAAIAVQDVTQAAQINRATFYAHFHDKYNLLDEWISERFRSELEKRSLDACHYTAENAKILITVVCQFLAHLHGDCAQPHDQFESLVEGTIKKQIFNLLTFWLRQSKSRLSPDIPATVATWAIYGLAAHYSHSKKRPALEKYVDDALPLVAINLEQFA